MLTPSVGCSGYDEFDYAVIIHQGRLMGGRRPVICRMFPVFKHHLMLTYLRYNIPACANMLNTTACVSVYV